MDRLSNRKNKRESIGIINNFQKDFDLKICSLTKCVGMFKQQSEYIEQFFIKLNMSDTRPIGVTAERWGRLVKAEPGKYQPYREVVGSLLHAAMVSQPASCSL